MSFLKKGLLDRAKQVVKQEIRQGVGQFIWVQVKRVLSEAIAAEIERIFKGKGIVVAKKPEVTIDGEPVLRNGVLAGGRLSIKVKFQKTQDNPPGPQDPVAQELKRIITDVIAKELELIFGKNGITVNKKPQIIVNGEPIIRNKVLVGGEMLITVSFG